MDAIGLTQNITKARENPSAFLRQMLGRQRAKEVAKMTKESGVTLAALLDFKFNLDMKLHKVLDDEIDMWVDVHTGRPDPMNRARLRYLFILMAVSSLNLQESAYRHLCASLSMLASESNIEDVLSKLEKVIEDMEC